MGENTVKHSTKQKSFTVMISVRGKDSIDNKLKNFKLSEKISDTNKKIFLYTKIGLRYLQILRIFFY